ncbi:MAG: hypothetical protein LUD68_03830, partial [Rikenellaceae bacterium]|nr:hypothetical protein [Rikenellaceae bacterium]
LLTPGYQESPFIPFTEVLNNGNPWINGQAFFIDAAENGIFEPVSYSISDLFGSINDSRYPYYWFSQLMKGADMITEGTVPFLAVSSRTIVFVPTKDAIEKALQQDAIPGIKGGSFDSEDLLVYDEIDENTLRNYLLSYFVSNTNNIILDFPYIGSRFSSGTYLSMNLENLNYVESGNSISVSLDGKSSVSVVSDYDLFPFVYGDGCFHFIESVL